MPSSYTVILESLDGLEDVVLKTTNIATEGDVIVVDVDRRLPLNRVWNCMLLTYIWLPAGNNSEGHRIE